MKKISRALYLIIAALFITSACSTSKSGETNGNDSTGSAAEAATKVYPDTATLIFFGDAMQHQMQFDQAKKLGTATNPYNYDDCFTLLTPALKDADYSVVNLELPLGGGTDYSGYPQFSAPDSYAIALKNAGFDLFLTSNNHCLDRRDRGLRRTLDVLDSLKIDHIGTYRNAAERTRLVPFVKEINGMKVGFLNYTYGTNGISASDGAEVAYIDKEKIKQEIEATRKAGAEIIVAMPHWGIEYVLTENESQRDLANFLRKEGVDIVIGGHPHVVQPMKVFTDSVSGNRQLVVYSLGNMISNMTKANTRGGALVRVVIERDKNTGKVKFRNAEYDTFITEVPSGGKTNFRVVPSWDIAKLPESQKSNWTQHNNTVQDLYDKHNVDVPRSKKKY